MARPIPEGYYSLAKTAHLFKSAPSTIKARCTNGEFDYTVDEHGHWLITRESILKHLKELEARNDA